MQFQKKKTIPNKLKDKNSKRTQKKSRRRQEKVFSLNLVDLDIFFTFHTIRSNSCRERVATSVQCTCRFVSFHLLIILLPSRFRKFRFSPCSYWRDCLNSHIFSVSIPFCLGKEIGRFHAARAANRGCNVLQGHVSLAGNVVLSWYRSYWD